MEIKPLNPNGRIREEKVEHAVQYSTLTASKLTKDCINAKPLTDIFQEMGQDQILQPHHKIVEWSTTRCDYRYIYAAAENVDLTRLMPSVEKNICCILPLRKALPGLFSFSLPIPFYMIDPN